MGAKKGQEIEVEVENVAYGGLGVARVDGLVIFIRRALPGQRLVVKIIKKRSSFCEAIPIEVLRESPWVVTPKCTHFGVCGGCIWQDLFYGKQLEIKTQQVIESVRHIGGLSVENIMPTIPSPTVYFYRNKLEFTFGRRRWLLPAEIKSGKIKKPKGFALGFHVRGHWEKVVDIDSCVLQSPITNQIVKRVKNIALESGHKPYDTLSHRGFWRFLVIRHSKTTDELLVNLITASPTSNSERKVIEKIARSLQKDCSKVSSFVHSISDKKAQVAYGDFHTVLFGSGTIKERLGDLDFSFSLNSFFQTNTLGTKKLYDVVLNFLEPSGKEVVWDLYCGAGTIGVYLARSVKKVVGIELLPEAVRDAKSNARRNGISNCFFFVNDLVGISERLKDIIREHGNPDAVIVDPPRSGMHKDVVRALLNVAPTRIISVSCNPTTFARDACRLCEKYRLSKLRVVDLFPHTSHMETVGLMVKNR